MPGNGKVFVSYAPEDSQVCLPLFAALDAWEVDYHAAPAALDPAQQIPPAVQRDIAERDVFIRVCSPAAQHSIPMNLQVSVFRALQAGERQRSHRANRALINLILVPGYVREPFDNATIFIDATNRPRQDWLNELGRAVGGHLAAQPPQPTRCAGPGRRGGCHRRLPQRGGHISAGLPVAHAAPQVSRRARSSGRSRAVIRRFPVPPSSGTRSTPSRRRVYTPFALTDGRQLWRGTPSVKRIYGAPVVVGNVLYVSLDSTIYALNTASGSKRWSVALESGEDLGGGPTYFDGVLYTISSSGVVTARSASDGKKRWSQQTTAAPDLTDYISTPVADASGVYFASLDHNCYALDKATGAVKWNYLTRGPIHSSPAVADGVVYFGGEDSYVYALKARAMARCSGASRPSSTSSPRRRSRAARSSSGPMTSISMRSTPKRARFSGARRRATSMRMGFSPPSRFMALPRWRETPSPSGRTRPITAST